MKTLLLGKTGMLGSAFFSRLPQCVAPSREELDVSDLKALRAFVLDLNPDLVINCVAYTAVDQAEDDNEEAFLLNAQVPGVLAESCAELGAILVHFSTDYVFDGYSQKSWKEDDLALPVNVYGGSKLAGEKMIAERMERYYIVRTAWLYGPNGRNFVDTMLKLASERDEIGVVNDQYGCPTYTFDLVEAVLGGLFEADFGIFHLCGGGACSWFEFAQEIFRLKGLDVRVNPLSSAEYPRPAKRPHYSVLVNSKLPSLRSWKESLADYLDL